MNLLLLLKIKVSNCKERLLVAGLGGPPLSLGLSGAWPPRLRPASSLPQLLLPLLEALLFLFKCQKKYNNN